MVCIVVVVWRSNTQPCLQAAYSVHSGLRFGWRGWVQYWTCYSGNPCGNSSQSISSRSIPVLSQPPAWPTQCSSYSNHKTPDRQCSTPDRTAESKTAAGSTAGTWRLWRNQNVRCWRRGVKSRVCRSDHRPHLTGNSGQQHQRNDTEHGCGWRLSWWERVSCESLTASFIAPWEGCVGGGDDVHFA